MFKLTSDLRMNYLKIGDSTA